MAMRSATMINPMDTTDTPSTERTSDGLFRKLVLLLLLIGASVLWIVVWFRQSTSFPLLLSTFFADASLGLIAGFGSRIVMRNRNPFIRYLAAILIAITGMFMIGALTKWVLGIGPIPLERNLAKQIREISFTSDLWDQITSLGIGLRPLFDFSKLDWADPVHLGISLAMTVLSLQAWRRRPMPEPEPVEVALLPEPAPRVTRARRSRRAASSSNGRAHVLQPASWFNNFRQSPTPQPRVRSNNGNHSSGRNGANRVKDAVVRPKKKRLFRRKPKIQFALVEEHRCPYCLDLVTRNDPRGVKECDVCHTLHHADCWAITGICQVPHLNT